MNIDYAIRSNQAIRNDLKAKGLITTAKAIDLGIEALKRVKSERTMGEFSDRSLLPGETEE